MKYKIFKKQKFFFLLFFVLIFCIQNLIIKNLFFQLFSKRKRVGVINLPNFQNVGCILVKFAMFKKLEEFGFNSTIISPRLRIPGDISFMIRTMNSHILEVSENFTELNEEDFDYLIVNSDQTWGFYSRKFFYNVALLKFAENWKVNKFIYAASMGRYHWFYKKKDEELFKKLLKNFTGISFREKGTVELLEKHLNLKSVFVLDPTLLIDKQLYLNEIKNYKPNFDSNEKFIFVYQLDKNPILKKIIKEASEKFNFKVYKHKLSKSDYIESFLFGINNCQAVIADSYHGTIFSIIFNKPFISFSNQKRGKARFDSLKEIFNLEKRIIEPSGYSNININLLLEPLNINQTIFNKYKAFSINYLKYNLDLFH